MITIGVLRSSESFRARIVDPLASLVLNALDNLGMIEIQDAGVKFSWVNVKMRRA